MLPHVFVGVVSGLILGLYSGNIVWWLVLSVAFSLWPDVDTLVHLTILRIRKSSWRETFRWATGKWAHEHRNILHIPLLLMPLTAIISLWSWPVSLVFLVLSIIHFGLDSFGIGWGIRWVYPFSTRQWKFHQGSIQSWTPEELKEVVESEGDDNWLFK